VTRLTLEAQRQQVADQYKVVAHLAAVIAELYGDQVEITQAGSMDSLLPMRGRRSHELMDQLGDILNAHDAADDERDGWTGVVFEAARVMYPLGHNATTIGEADHG